MLKHNLRAPMHFSLKWLMIAVAMAAVSFAALVNASGAWAMAVITAIAALLLAAALVVAAGSGRSQAFAKGFLIGALFYIMLRMAAVNDWFGPGNADYLTTSDIVTERVVDQVYDLVKRETPPALPTPTMAPGGPMGGAGMTSGMPGGTPAGGMGMAMSGGMMGLAGPTFTPDSYHFHKIAHWLIAFYIGLASGLFTTRLRSARSVA
jgi:hypothetical protein